MSIRVLAGGRVEIVTPPCMRARAIEHFVRQHRWWIERKVSESRFLFPVTPEAVPERIELDACGEVWRLQRSDSSRPALRQDTAGRMLAVSSEPTSVAGLRRQLQGWLSERAREVLVPWLGRLADQGGFSITRVQIRRQRTRWGSCSPSGTISLNCCLLFQSPAVVRYLLLHELCHTRHMNHSPRFWHLVARHEPDYRRLDRALTRGWQNVPAWVWEPPSP